MYEWFLLLIFLSIFEWRHAQMLLHILTKEGGIGEIEVIGNLQHRHVGESETALDGLEGEELYHDTRSPIHGLLQQHRQVFGGDIQLTGKIIHLADTSVTLLHQLHELIS